MIGIGGCGMSGLAQMLQSRGGRVSGCDHTRTTLTRDLERRGISVTDDDGSDLPDNVRVAMADGATRDVPTASIPAMLTRNGGEPLEQ